MTSETIAFWTMVGAWVSGVATFSAVLVSLHIANRKPKAYVTGNVGIKIIVGKNSVGSTLEKSGLAITIVNQSSVPVKIVGINWVFGGDIVFHQIFGDVNSDELPKRIEYGEQAFFWISFDDDDEWIKRFSLKLSENNGSLKKLKCSVSLSTGKSFFIKPDKAFISKLKNYS